MSIMIDMEMPEDCQECPMYDEYGECIFLDTFAAQYGRLPDCPLRETIRCNQCRFYEGVHNVQGCAPCAFRGIGAVMWDDYCKRGERYDTD